VLAGVLSGRSLDGARSPAQVLHHRITTAFTGRLTPRIDSAADLIPRDVPAEWQPWLEARAEAADLRRHELGAQAAAEPPRWALDALGPVPEEVVARQEWEHRAGWAAAYRELAGHTDESDPLGKAPVAGLAENAALFRAAHEALNLVDAGAEEADLTDGQLRARSHALTREEVWAPQFVADQLSVTHQHAEKARTDAVIWSARADTATDPAEADQLRVAAASAAELARDLSERAASLEGADDARAAWFAHTAVTRDNALRARAELRARGIDPENPDDGVTAEEWFAAERADTAEADQFREIRDEFDIADTDEAELRAPICEDIDQESPVDARIPDIRDTSTTDAGERTDSTERHRVPTVDETAEAVGRAQAALAEIAAREEAERAQQAADGQQTARLYDLTRWNQDEQVAQAEGTRERVDEPAMER
jgi:hypothetical protein